MDFGQPRLWLVGAQQYGILEPLKVDMQYAVLYLWAVVAAVVCSSDRDTLRVTEAVLVGIAIYSGFTIAVFFSRELLDIIYGDTGRGGGLRVGFGTGSLIPLLLPLSLALAGYSGASARRRRYLVLQRQP